jgi:hypothetical protein
MHYTLNPRLNIALTALMVLFVIGCIVSGGMPPAPLLLAFGAGGALTGYLQNIAHRRQAQELKSAQTATQVRMALAATKEGKLASLILMLQLIAVLVIVFGGKQYANPMGMVAAIALFSAARKAATLPALFALRN